MEELWELRHHLEVGDYGAALQVLDEMDEMSRKDTIYKLQSFMEILLIHLIKQRAEQRTTRSWELSIRTSCHRIHRPTNAERPLAGSSPGQNCMRPSMRSMMMLWTALLSRPSKGSIRLANSRLW